MAKSLIDFVKNALENIEQIQPDRLEEMIKERNDLLVLDIREQSEYAAGHIPNAYLVPRGTLEGAADENYKKRDPVLCNARKRPIVLVCSTGGRSALATYTLNQMGFEETYNLAGGMELWEAEDLPVTRHDS